ncbi:MAG: immune inhibitor A [Caldilineales bacterium]|nr:immune inhibitor A [Caldilineales bacterium]
MKKTTRFVIVLLVATMLLVALASAAVLANDDGGEIVDKEQVTAKKFPPKDQPDPAMYRQRRQVEKAILSGDKASAQQLSGEDKVLVLLLDFAGTDVITWNPGDQWDPYGVAEVVDAEDLGDCSNVITETMIFTYTPTLHNQVPKPPTAEAAYKGATANLSFTMWAPDFSNEYYHNMVFGEGLHFSYEAENGDPVDIDINESMRTYYETLSKGQYTVSGDVIGWIPLPHSAPWYGADLCPGNLSFVPISGAGSDGWYGYNPEVETDPRTDYGTPKTAIMDAIDWIKEEMPDFPWTDYDTNGDGVFDGILVVSAGVGEANGGASEHAVWPHSSSVNYCIEEDTEGDCTLRTGRYIWQGETTGVSTFTHEYGHFLGADDLYAYGFGETSAGIWSNMSDDRGQGLPWDSGSIGMDPWHMLGWGWLDPVIVNYDDPPMEITLGQSADLPEGTHDSILVRLPDQQEQIEEAYSGEHMWWGGRENLMNNLVYRPVDLTGASTAELTFYHHYDIEEDWDYGFVQVSTDEGATWTSLANENTTDTYDPNAIDYVIDNLPGFTAHNDGWTMETFDMSAYAGQTVWLGFRYATDWGTLENGWWVDDIMVTADGNTVFFDDVESGQGPWMTDPSDGWVVSNGLFTYPHYYLAEWRNDAGIDHNLAVGRCDVQDWGMVLWYINDQKYTANEIYDYSSDVPSFGPKGKALVVDAHPDPLRDTTSPYAHNARSNISYRCYGVRDVAFGLTDLDPFYVTQSPTNPSRWGNPNFEYPGQPAVSAFHDSMGYYPGLEYTNIRSATDPRGPANYWTAKERDASVVVPARDVYGVAPANYPSGTGFLQWMYDVPAWYGFWDWPSGTGNPGDTWAQYGVHLQVVEEAEDGSWGKVQFWNSQFDYEGSVTQTPSADPLMYGDTVDVHVNATNIGSRVDSTVIVLLDHDVKFVSASGGAYPLTMGALSEMAAAHNVDLGVAAASAQPGDVVAVAWQQNPLLVGDEVDFGFTVEVTSYSGWVHHDAIFYDDSWADVRISGGEIEIVDDGLRTVELPLMYDTWVNGGIGAQGTNYNAFANITSRTTGLDNGFFVFDRSSLPEGMTIVSAEMKLNMTGQSGAFGKSLTALNVNDFDPMTVTYNTAPATYNPGASVPVPDAGGEVAFDVASQVAAWDAAGALAEGAEGMLAVAAAGPPGRVVFDSLESFNGAPASLVVTYSIDQ